tara:strand:+ start:958 stop:1437 length:480 start_codon:yes stop_codon:yes gene_type:complete
MYNFLIPSLLAAFGWGVNPLFDRYAMKYLDKYSYIIIRLITTGLIGLIGLGIILRKNTKLKQAFNNLKTNIFKFNPIYCGIITAIIWCLSLLCYYTAISNIHIPIVNITLISYTAPIIFLTILAYIFYNEKINLHMIIGMMLTFIGLYITVTYNPNNKL